MDLPSYIEKVGDAKAAALFKVEQRTAASWRRRERSPRPRKAAFIVERTNGLVSLEEIYQSETAA